MNTEQGRAAELGALESPAYARRGLVPKVAIGSRYEPPKRETLDIRAGVYRGFNPARDADANVVQAALIGSGLAVVERKKKRGRVAEIAAWAIGCALLATLGWLVLIVGPAVW